jgi:hypothetical protein
MAGLLTNPGFQRALLKKRASAIGGGQSFNTADISRSFAGEQMQRQLQFQGIEDQKRRAMTGISQQGRLLDLDEGRLGLSRKQLRKSKKNLGQTAMMGIGTSLLAGVEGRRRRGVVAESNKTQAAQRQQIIDILKAQELRNKGRK